MVKIVNKINNEYFDREGSTGNHFSIKPKFILGPCYNRCQRLTTELSGPVNFGAALLVGSGRHRPTGQPTYILVGSGDGPVFSVVDRTIISLAGLRFSANN
jgi:hypothetical protein